MQDYQGNSHKKKAAQEQLPEKSIEKVVTGEVVQRKKSLGRKFKDIFFGGEFKAAASYVAADVLLPSLRNMLADASKGAIDRVIYGESAYQRRGRPNEYRPRISYNNPVRRDPRDPRDRAHLPDQPPHPYRQNRHEASEIVLANREEAQLVLERLLDVLDKYEVASLADLYDLVGLPSNHTDNKWGWTYLSNAQVTQVREGYLLELPPLEPI